MATIKSFTDISQSKKLAEILPLESADMRIGNYVGKSGKVDGTNVHYYPKGESFGAPEIINAWSLASLLGVLPNENMLVKTTDGEYYCLAKDVMTKHYDNPVDACVTMIEELYDLNLL